MFLRDEFNTANQLIGNNFLVTDRLNGARRPDRNFAAAQPKMLIACTNFRYLVAFSGQFRRLSTCKEMPLKRPPAGRITLKVICVTLHPYNA